MTLNTTPIPALRGAYKTMLSGRVINLADPQPDQIDIDDIAVGLSRIARFNGQTSVFYSVAQHSLLCAELAAQDKASPALQLCALIHDAHEAYWGDDTTPKKELLTPADLAHERRLKVAVLSKFGLLDLFAYHASDIKRWDLEALAIEHELLVTKHAPDGTPLAPWAILYGVPVRAPIAHWVTRDLRRSQYDHAKAFRCSFNRCRDTIIGRLL
jgi:uncharacterized protein